MTRFVRDVADRIVFMDGGVILEVLPAFSQPRTEWVRRFLKRYDDHHRF
jgi:ABC-type polar amino acid transport system ATPase subunit